MADLTTPEGIKAEILATIGYDVDDDLDLAKRFAKAVRAQILTLAQSASSGDDSYALAIAAAERQFEQALSFVAAKSSQSEADRLANPSVIHADFSGTGKYAGGGG
jgi:hypothetical protein